MPGQMITVPQATSIAALDDIGRGRAPGARQKIGIEPVCFQVVSYSIAGKKFVETESVRRVRRMLLPAMVQKYSRWNMEAFPCDRLQVYTDGMLQMVDLCKVIDWKVHKDIRWWTVGTSDVAGCWELSEPEVFADKQWSALQI